MCLRLRLSNAMVHSIQSRWYMSANLGLDIDLEIIVPNQYFGG